MARKKAARKRHDYNKYSTPACEPMQAEDSSSEIKDENLRLWSSPDGESFYAVSETCKKLPPDVYNFIVTPQGPMFVRLNYSTQDIIKFEDSVVDEVVAEIQEFWKKESLFKQFELPFKRGLLLWGPAGVGKSCIVKLAIDDIIKKGGIAVKFVDTGYFVTCMRTFRHLQPDTPVVVIMEDLESIIDNNSTSSLLNMLDGLEGFEKLVYLATTNYPETLEPRFKNRPSRFDRRFKIDYPSDKTRKIYLEHLASKSSKIKIDIKSWINDTNNMSFAHVKELFISVNLFGRPYDESLKIIKDMNKNISSEDRREVGFAQKDIAAIKKDIW